MKSVIRFKLAVIVIILVASQSFSQLTSNREGRLDLSYGSGGLADLGPYGSAFGDSAILPDDSVLFAGTWATTTFSIVVSKQRPNGQPDEAFAQYGFRSYAFSQNSYATSLLVQPDGKMVIGGSIETDPIFIKRDFLVIRLMPNGDLDQTFGTGGVFSMDLSPADSGLTSDDQSNSLILQPDGKIIVAGMSDQYETGQTRGASYSVLVRLDEAGAVDTSFGTDGISMVLVGNNKIPISSLRYVTAKFSSSGNIMAGVTVQREFPGSPDDYPTHALVLRYLPNGTLDPTFSDDGMLDISRGYTPTYPSFFGTLTEVADERS